MKRPLRIFALIGVLLVLSPLPDSAVDASSEYSGMAQGSEPPGNLILDKTVVFDDNWFDGHPGEGWDHTELVLPGPGVLNTVTDGYRPDPGCGVRGENCRCAYGGGVRFFVFDTDNQQVAGFGTGDTVLSNLWVNGGILYADADFCKSSSADIYDYISFIKVYFDPDPDMDRVPDSSDACPGTPRGATVDEQGCSQAEESAPPSPVPSTADVAPQVPQISISVSANSFHAFGEEIQLTVMVTDAQGAPMAGELVQVAQVEPEGEWLQGYTDASGNAYFMVSHFDESAVNYTYYVKVAEAEQWLEIPVISESVPAESFTATPGPTATLPVEFSISRLVILQAVEGGELIGGRDIGVRVFVNWSGGRQAEFEAVAKVHPFDPLPSVRKTLKAGGSDNAINLVLPRHYFEGAWDQPHEMEVGVRILSIDGQPLSPPPTLRVKESFNTRSSFAQLPKVLYVPLDPSISWKQVNAFAARAQNYLNQVYPVPYFRQSGFQFRVGTTLSYYAQRSPIGISWTPEFLQKLMHAYPQRALLVATEHARQMSISRGSDVNFAVGIYPADMFPAEGFADKRRTGIGQGPACNSIDTPENVAHEIGHLYGLPVGKDEEYDANSPGVYLPGGVSIWRNGGFYTIRPGTTLNFMGNVGLVNATWVNADTWNYLAKVIHADITSLSVRVGAPISLPEQIGPKPVEGDAFFITGAFSAEGEAVFLSVDHLLQYEQNAEVPRGEVSVRALDDSGNILSSVPVNIILSDKEDADSTASMFTATLPVSSFAQVAEIQLVRSDVALTSLSRSASAPQVSFDPLPVLGDTPATISWHAEDLDGDPLRSTLFYSDDGGQTWELLGTNFPETSVDIDPATLPGGEGRFLVVVSDGLLETEAESSAFSLPDKAPWVFIDSPGENDIPDDGATLFTGYVVDDTPAESGIMQTWWYSGSEILGEGPYLALEGLDPGQYTVTYSARDASGQVSQSDVTFTVSSDSSSESTTVIPEASGWWTLFYASSCAWVLTAGGLVVLVFFSRKRTFARWLLPVSIGTIALCTISSCVLGLMAFNSSPGDTITSPTDQPQIPTPTVISPPQPAPVVPTPALTGQGEQVQVTLVNNLQDEVCYVNISPSGDEEWGQDLLGEGVTLPYGQSITFRLPAGTYDLRALDCEGNVLVEQYNGEVLTDTEWTLME